MASPGEYKELYTKWLRKLNNSGDPRLDALIDIATNTGTPKDFYLEVEKGNVPGHYIVNVDAVNPKVSSGTSLDVWPAGSNLVYPVSGEQWEVVSSSANDNATGAGARQVSLTYLDDNYDEQIEVITLDGTTPVETIANDIFRPTNNKFGSTVVLSAGSSLENEGDITIRVVGGGDTRGFIAAGFGSSAGCHFTVPVGKDAYIINTLPSTQKGDDAVFTLNRTAGDTRVFLKSSPIGSYQSSFVATPVAPISMGGERSDYKVTVISDTQNAAVAFNTQILVVEHDS